MKEVPPITLAAWRLQLTTVLLLIGAVYQWRTGMDVEVRAQALGSWRLVLGSGTCLAIHFGSWVWGLQHTSLTHSLLFVCCAPLLMALGMWALRMSISRGEVGGTLLGFLGGVLLAVGPRSAREAQEVTVAGDLASLMAAVAFVGYMAAGRTLRRFMPIFVYAAPVTGVAAAQLTLLGLAFERHTVIGASNDGVLGWLASARYAPWVVYLAVGPGIVGHTGFNTLLRYLTPLTVSLAFQLEPLVGTLIGWAAGVAPAPGWSTYVGGAVVLASTCAVTYAATQRELREERKGVAALELENVFTSEEGEAMLLPVSQPAAGLAGGDYDDRLDGTATESDALLGHGHAHLRHGTSNGGLM